MARTKYAPGDKFNLWTILEQVGARHWRARCDCGHEAVGTGTHFSKGSKGCRACSCVSRRTVTYDNPAEWRSWVAMRSRCTHSNRHDFKHYGGRGVTYCPTWESFEQFFADMGPRPPGYSLDRLDPDLPYSKENCRWATQSQQMRNLRKQRTNGLGRPIIEAAEEAGLSYSMVTGRLHNGWTLERALTEPKMDYSTTLAARARAAGLGAQTVWGRVQRGWTEEEALSTPVGVRRS